MPLAGLEPVSRHETLAEDVYRMLRSAIMTGAVKPGEKISARSVAQSAKVSLTPAREAVSRLLGEGALELVGPKTVAVPQLSIEALDEITCIRLNVEGLAAEAAAPNFTASDVHELETIENLYEKTRTRKSFQDSLIINEEFHFKIYRASRMPRLIGFIESLWLQTGPSFNFLRTSEPLSEQPIDYHRQAIEGLKAHDGERVKIAIQTDIEFGYERLRELIEQ